MLVVLIALSGVIQHGRMATAEGPGHHLSAMSGDQTPANAQHSSKQQQPFDTKMTDICTIICHGTPTPWITVAQLVPVMNGQSLAWPFTDADNEGRGVRPGFRPPKSI